MRRKKMAVLRPLHLRKADRCHEGHPPRFSDSDDHPGGSPRVLGFGSLWGIPALLGMILTNASFALEVMVFQLNGPETATSRIMERETLPMILSVLPRSLTQCPISRAASEEPRERRGQTAMTIFRQEALERSTARLITLASVKRREND